MKRIIALLLVCLLLCMTACGKAPENNQDFAFTMGGNSDKDIAQETRDAEEGEEFYFMAGDVKIVPGMIFDSQAFPTDEVYEVPSCALEGTDNVYNYGSYEITAFNDGEKEVVYSIFFVETDVTTPEGLANGDDMSKAAELYGEYTEDGTSWIFTRGSTQLHVIGENDVIVSVELRMAD